MKRSCETCDPLRDHAPDNLDYCNAHDDAEQRMRRGEAQLQCPNCKLWYWPKRKQ